MNATQKLFLLKKEQSDCSLTVGSVKYMLNLSGEPLLLATGTHLSVKATSGY